MKRLDTFCKAASAKRRPALGNARAIPSCSRFLRLAWPMLVLAFGSSVALGAAASAPSVNEVTLYAAGTPGAGPGANLECVGALAEVSHNGTSQCWVAPQTAVAGQGSPRAYDYVLSLPRGLHGAGMDAVLVFVAPDAAGGASAPLPNPHLVATVAVRYGEQTIAAAKADCSYTTLPSSCFVPLAAKAWDAPKGESFALHVEFAESMTLSTLSEAKNPSNTRLVIHEATWQPQAVGTGPDLIPETQPAPANSLLPILAIGASLLVVRRRFR